MVLNLDSVDHRHESLIHVATQMGLDAAHASDVLDAVYSYCHYRHGHDQVEDVYLVALMERAAGAWAHRAKSIDLGSISANPRQLRLLSALRCSSDPFAIHEVYRRRFVYPADSSVTSCGCAMVINLSRLSVASGEDNDLFYAPSMKQLALWVNTWLNANPDIDTIIIKPGKGGDASGITGWLEKFLRRGKNSESTSSIKFIVGG
ncbi:MAG TPA: hypothetical protein PJ991_04720 [Kiritimatiellia bacterium]|nr:hypothetical protein [Kiritimatiellia bacterium]